MTSITNKNIHSPMSLTYNQVRELILKTLEERPAGTKVEVPNQQNYELALLDYFQQLETTMSTSLVGIATAETTPIEPPQARVAYLAQQASSTTTVFENFMDGEGNPISITTDVDHVAFITLFWNTQYWSYQAVMIPVIYPGGDVLTKDVVSELPETGEENVVYLIVDPKDPTAYTMHMWLNGAWATVGGAMGAVRFDVPQDLLLEQKVQALKNIGLDYVIIEVTNGTATLTQAQEDAMIAARGVLITGSVGYEPATRRVYTLGQIDGNIVSGYSLLSGSLLLTLSYNKTTKVLTVNSASQQLIDQGAVRFNTAQSLNDTQKTQALANLGLGITLVPATVFDTAVTDAQDAQIKTAKGIIIDGIPRIYYYGNTDGDNTYFFSVNNNGMFHVLRYDTSTKLFIRPYSSYITDLTSVHFDKVQNLSDTQKAQARQNIGINLDTLLTSSSIKGVEIVNEGEAPSEQNGMLYIEVKPDTNA